MSESPASPPLPFAGLMWRSVALGVFTGVFGAIYLILIEEGTHAIWPEWADPDWFSGTWPVLVIPIAAGLIVGILYKVLSLPSRFPGFIEELEEGRVEPTTMPSVVLVAIVSLIGGASVGPEAPMGTAGGGAGTWLSERMGKDEERTRQLSFVGISGAFGGLLSTPIGGPLMAYELEHDQSTDYYFRHLVPGVVAGAVAFGIMWPIVGAPFDGLLALEQPDFKSWMLLAAVGLGVVGVIGAMVVGKLLVLTTRLFEPLTERPIVRGLVGGIGVALIGWTLPLTLFSGQTSIPVVLEDFEAIGIATLIALGILKALALGVSLGSGMFGGPIFPMFFVGTSFGLAVHLAIPDIPLALAVGAVMAAVGAAAALLPLSMAVIVTVMISGSYEIFGAIALATMTAFALRYLLMKRNQPSDVAVSMATHDQGD